MRILITGVTGFAGGHLAETLSTGRNKELFGISRRGEWPAEWHHLKGVVTLLSCDLCDSTTLENILQNQIKPEGIFHLAGYAQAGKSFEEPDQAWTGNLTATRSLYEAVARLKFPPRIVYVGSGLIYGDLDPGCHAHTELSPMRPANPYAASKAAADLASYQYSKFPGLEIVRARPFNHIGPRQSPQFAVAHFAQQIVAIEKGRKTPLLETGNLTPLRDLTDVRDVVEAYCLLMDRGRTGEAYNVAGGEAFSMQSVLDRLLGLSRVNVQIRQQTQLVRVVETAAVRGDAGKIRKETGWQPRHSLEQTLNDILDYWRGQP
ncbi:MAG TPA: GDP-mannose 4,6-dehydratase [Gemmataceae bacterium]|jgi:GDP-4-dehydro-6-deoxy-D-mannose reductase|nr:GDP-mannose 4,6-dehydratase [Gemmataceae bacterium]